MARIGLFTGSFDPVTLGHLAIIERASRLFDILYVGLFVNEQKKGYFSLDDRRDMLEKACQDFSNVIIITSSEQLAVEVAREYQVTSFVRGLRQCQDLTYETELAFYNHHLAPEIETIFLLTDPSLANISSTRVRELLQFGADITPFVPRAVYERIEYESD